MQRHAISGLRGLAVNAVRVNVGKHKAVVHACADQRGKRPSMEDVLELYDLEADPAETKNIAAVGGGPAVVEAF